MMTEKEFGGGFGILQGVCGQQPDGTLGMYYQILQDDFTGEEWLKTCLLWVRTNRWFPKPPDLLECKPGYVSKDEKAVQAWDHIWDEKDRLTAYNPHVQAHPHGRNCEPIALKAIGGVEGLNRLWAKQGDPRDVEFLKKEFLKEFKRLMEDDQRGALQLDAPSTKAFADRGGIKKLGAAIDGLEDTRR